MTACAQLTKMSRTLASERAVSFFGAKRVDQFGVCSPFHLDRHDAGLFMCPE